MQKIKEDIRPRNSYYLDEPKEFNVGFIPHRSGTYRIEIDSSIESVSQFSTAIQALELAKEEDQVEILLQSPGGSVDAGDAFIHSMAKCAAPIHIIASGGCHSMASQILLMADSFELSRGFNAVIHAGQNGAYGTVSEYNTKASFDADFRTRQFRETYKYFMTEEEITGMLKGQDIILDADQWMKRSEARNECYKNEQVAMKEAYEASLAAAEESAQELTIALAKPAKKPLKLPKKQLASE